MRTSLSTTVLGVDDLTTVIADVGLDAFMDELIEVLGTEIGNFDPAKVEDQIRSGFNYHDPEHGLVEWMPTMATGEVVSVKTVGYHPANPGRRGIPSVLATTALYDTTNGSLTTICEATLLTALRTGAASAIVTDVATSPDPITLGVVGCGAQAVTQIHAISRVRKIARLVVTDTNPLVATSLAARLPDGLPTPDIVDSDTFDQTIGDFDVICTCTSVAIGEGPVVRLAGARANLHINAVGADFPGKTELPLDYLRTSTVIPDVVGQCLIEGECQVLDQSELGPSMAELLSEPDRHLVDSPTVFDSTGWSYEDLLAAQLFGRHAQRLGLGTSVALQRLPIDPYDPYETLRLAEGRRVTQPIAELESNEGSALVRDLG